MTSLLLALMLAFQAQGVAPNISGFSIQGSTVNLSSFKGKKPVLVVFYRTEGWGYCRAQLGELQKSYAKIKELGAEMIAVSADPPASGQKVAAELNLSYPILSDVYRNFIKQYGVLHPTEGIARPSMFIVNKEGKIVWKYVGTDATDRPPINTVLQQLAAAK
jgi:mycoredoxin-dependent peroxiredoxin